MRPIAIKIAVTYILCLSNVNLFAQAIVNDAGEREKHFIYEVKQIDEFFERFNDDNNSFVRKVYAKYHIKYNLSRANLIKSLFNYETKSWNAEEIDRFVSAATNEHHPKKLDFYSGDWYAEAKCKFKQNENIVDITLILKIDTQSMKRSKWVIAGVKSNTLKATGNPVIALAKDPNKFINPASHANNFIELDIALEDKMNLTDYFDSTFFNRKNAMAFYDAILNSRIKFLYVKEIKYHFLQMEKWIFTVDYFPRDALNSGWLINTMQNVSLTEMENYRKNLLGD